MGFLQGLYHKLARFFKDFYQKLFKREANENLAPHSGLPIKPNGKEPTEFTFIKHAPHSSIHTLHAAQSKVHAEFQQKAAKENVSVPLFVGPHGSSVPTVLECVKPIGSLSPSQNDSQASREIWRNYSESIRPYMGLDHASRGSSCFFVPGPSERNKFWFSPPTGTSSHSASPKSAFKKA